jgi:hypothetical protein
MIAYLGSSCSTGPLDFAAWLPASMRDVGRRWRFGTRWASDGGAVVNSGEAADDERGPRAWTVKRTIFMRDRTPSEPRVLGDRVCIGSAVIEAAYHGLVMELFPRATWEVESLITSPAVAMVGDRAVAVVMPLRAAEVTRG